MSKTALTAMLTVLMFHAVASNPHQYCSRQIEPLVSTEWLAAHMNDANLIMIDVRSAENYSNGHIPQSSNAPVTQWWVIRDDLLLELPEPEDLRNYIGASGISVQSKVVIIGQTDSDYDRADGTRVAWTLIYGGVKNVAVLNGGITKWITEEREISTESYAAPAVVYSGIFNNRIAVSKNYVTYFLNSATIVDARIPDDFFGVSPLMFSEKEGHIKGAACLPTPWIFTPEGSFREIDELEEMASGVVGRHKQQRIIVYCGVGGYASTWWFVLSEVLGYQKVRVYDGSIQEWTRDPDAPVEKFSW